MNTSQVEDVAGAADQPTLATRDDKDAVVDVLFAVDSPAQV